MEYVHACNFSLSDDNISRHDIIRCNADEIFERETVRDFLQDMLLLYSAFFVFYMQTGFSMLCAGSVRLKNVSNTMLKNLLDICGGSIAFYAVGYAFAFGGMDHNSPEKRFIGTSNFFLHDVEDLSFWLFQFTVSTASTTIIAGTVAERCQMVAYLSYSFLMISILYPIIAHAIWNPNGYFCPSSISPLWGVGVIDFAGSGVVHLTGGTAALIATSILGPRRGRFYDRNGKPLTKPKEIHGHSPALQMLGTFNLWFGWFGFNSGAALTHYVSHIEEVLALAAVNTLIAGGVGACVAVFARYKWLDRYTGEPAFELLYLRNGALSGLVAITGGCGIFEPWAAIIVGFVAALLYMVGTTLLVKLRLDDAVDAIPVHMLNGAWGLIAVGLFASPTRLGHVYGRYDHPGLVYSNFMDWRLLGMQFLGILYVMVWVVVIMVPFFHWLEYRGWLRADPLEEIVGLDISYHGGLVLHGDKNSVILAAELNGKRETLPFGSMLATGPGGLETLHEEAAIDEDGDDDENSKEDDSDSDSDTESDKKSYNSRIKANNDDDEYRKLKSRFNFDDTDEDDEDDDDDDNHVDTNKKSSSNNKTNNYESDTNQKENIDDDNIKATNNCNSNIDGNNESVKSVAILSV